MRPAYYRHQESVTEARRRHDSNRCWHLENTLWRPLLSSSHRGWWESPERSCGACAMPMQEEEVPSVVGVVVWLFCIINILQVFFFFLNVLLFLLRLFLYYNWWFVLSLFDQNNVWFPSEKWISKPAHTQLHKCSKWNAKTTQCFP